MSEYRFLWSNSHQLFYMLGNIDAYRCYSSVPFCYAEFVFQVSEGNLMSCYLGNDDLARSVEEGKLLLDQPFARKYIQDARTQCRNHREFFSHLNSSDMEKASEAELLGYWRELIDNYAHSVAYFRSTQEEPTRLLIKTVTDVVTPERAADLLLSTELDEINKEEVAWENLLRKGFDRDLALTHLRQFPWLFQNTLSYDETIDELEQRKDSHISRDIQAEKQELAAKQATILSEHPELSEKIETLHQLALLRPEIKACWASTGFYAAPILSEISRKTGVDYRVLTFLYRSEDIDRLLETGKSLTPSEVEARKLCTAYLFKGGILQSFVGEEALAVKKEVLGEGSKSEVRELKGAAARHGKVTGRVHILKINDPESTKAFRESFTEGILVTSMTQPNVVDIARRASAIVTDEGGMLCHAAIIAREFGIPCVVGTHRATQVLKDGDLVEVDADNGIITIIERASEVK